MARINLYYLFCDYWFCNLGRSILFNAGFRFIKGGAWHTLRPMPGFSRWEFSHLAAPIFEGGALQNFTNARTARSECESFVLPFAFAFSFRFATICKLLQNALLRQSAKMKCKNDGPLRRSAKMKCKSDGLPGGADFTTPQRVCQVFFRPLVELGRFGLVCWAPDPPRYFSRLKRVCQVLNEPFLEQIRANLGRSEQKRLDNPALAPAEFFGAFLWGFLEISVDAMLRKCDNYCVIWKSDLTF